MIMTAAALLKATPRPTEAKDPRCAEEQPLPLRLAQPHRARSTTRCGDTGMNAPTRRDFIAGSLTMAFALSAAPMAQAQTEELPTDLKRNPDLDAWLRIGANGAITLLVGKVELGQGCSPPSRSYAPMSWTWR